VIKKYTLSTLSLFVISTAIFSCQNKHNNVPPPVGNRAYSQPVVAPLSFGKPVKINWAGAKTEQIIPVVTHLDIDQLPAKSYDTISGIPLAKPTGQNFDYESLPSRPLDIEKLPLKHLAFKTYLQPPPHFIKSGFPHLKDAKNPTIYELNGTDGIKGKIFMLLKDHNGFIWILTDRALYRYDGENLYQYLAFASDFTGDKYVIEDDKGRLWIAWGTGIEILDYQKNVLIKTDLNKTRDLGSNNILKCFETRNKKIWAFFTNGDIMVIDPDTRAYRIAGIGQGLKRSLILSSAEDEKGRMWLNVLGKGIEIIDPAEKTIKYLTKEQGLISDTMVICAIAPDKRVWISRFLGGNSNTIDIIDVQQHKIQYMTLPALCGRFITGLSFIDGQAWIATKNGEFIFDGNKQVVQQVFSRFTILPDFNNNAFEDNSGQQWFAGNNAVNIITSNKLIKARIGNLLTTSSTEDSEGNYWDASPDNGIDIINPYKKTIRNLDNAFLVKGVQSLISFKGKIYISANAGLCIFDPLNQTLTSMATKSMITAVMIDKKGRFWMCETKGVDIYDPRTNKMIYLTAQQGLMLNNFTSLFIDADNRTLLADQAGDVVVVAPDGLTARKLNNVSDANPIPRIFVQDKWGDIWMNYTSEIFAADFKHNKLYSFNSAYGSGGSIINLLADSSRIYGTDFNGVNTINLPRGGITPNVTWQTAHYSIDKINTNVYQTDALSKNGYYLWGDNGITVLDLSVKDKHQPKTYISGIAVGDGNLSFHNNFTAGKDTIWDADGKTYITGDKKAGDGLPGDDGLTYNRVTGPYNMPVDLKVAYNKNYLHFSYASFGKIESDSALYQYILIGYDKNWNAATTATISKLYFGLSPGSYTFKVSRLYNNTWGPTAELTFVVEAPWWETWWAFILYAAIFAGTVWCFVYYRSRQLIKTNQLLEYKVQQRTDEVLQQKEEIETQRDSLENTVQELKQTQRQLIQSEKMASLGELTAGIAHEIQNPLNFVNNFSEVNTELIDELQQEIDKGAYAEVKIIAVDIKANQQKINMHGKRAESIVKGMLEHSRASTGEKQLTNINMLADEFLKLSYHGLRAKDKSFNAGLVTAFDKSLPKINIAQQDIGRVLLNLFNNAFYAVNQKQKAAGADYKPEVTVSTSTEKNNIIIKVKDNGNGIPDAIKDKIMQPFFTTKPTGEGTGLGLSLSYDIVVKGHGGSISVDTKTGEFTEFIVTLPVS
jgi:signal transduction histidine kinase/ligand-binding sensor domain-containing protein